MGVCGSLPLGVCGPTGVCDPFSGTDRSGVGDLLGILLPRDLSTSPSSRIGVRSPLSNGSGLNAYGPEREGGDGEEKEEQRYCIFFFRGKVHGPFIHSKS